MLEEDVEVSQRKEDQNFRKRRIVQDTSVSRILEACSL